MLQLVELTLEMESAFENLCSELNTHGNDLRRSFLLMDYEKAKPELDFKEYVHLYQSWSRGECLPGNWTSASTYWLVYNDVILGRSSLRHELATEFLFNIGGQIGYYIRPSQRQKGYGTAILKLTLKKAKELELERVLVTCDEDNIASAKVIEKNGGVLENIFQNDNMNVPKRRYWIKL